MKNGWTGGQYSLYRALFGAYLFVHFVHLSFWGAEIFSSEGLLADGSLSPLLHAFPNVFALVDAPAFVVAVLVAAALLSLLFAVGRFDRVAAVGIWYVGACLLGRNPLISNPGLPYVGWLLLAHAFLPPAPYGSWAARGRTDPADGWRLTPSIFGMAWLLLAVGYAYSGCAKLSSLSWIDGSAFGRVLENPLARPTFLREWLVTAPPFLLTAATYGALGLELLYAPLALIRRARPWIWPAMVAMHLGLIVLVDFADLTIGMLMIHFFTFDPAWIPAKRGTGPERVFYDGACGLCHGTVRFLLAEDAGGETFRFAPLDSDSFRAAIPEERRKALPDSVVVVSPDGSVHVRSEGVRLLLSRLGGLWRLLSGALALVPRPVRDLAYDAIAAVRYRLFGRASGTCPLMPPDYRGRWLS